MYVACAIILLHTFVPHHHHDTGMAEGFVFESELTCHDEHHDCHCCGDKEHSHHPFDICKLQDLLSQLTLSGKEDKIFVAHQLAPTYLEIAPWMNRQVCMLEEPQEIQLFGNERRSAELPLPGVALLATRLLRAPPMV